MSTFVSVKDEIDRLKARTRLTFWVAVSAVAWNIYHMFIYHGWKF